MVAYHSTEVLECSFERHLQRYFSSTLQGTLFSYLISMPAKNSINSFAIFERSASSSSSLSVSLFLSFLALRFFFFFFWAFVHYGSSSDYRSASSNLCSSQGSSSSEYVSHSSGKVKASASVNSSIITLRMGVMDIWSRWVYFFLKEGIPENRFLHKIINSYVDEKAPSSLAGIASESPQTSSAKSSSSYSTELQRAYLFNVFGQQQRVHLLSKLGVAAFDLLQHCQSLLWPKAGQRSGQIFVARQQLDLVIKIVHHNIKQFRLGGLLLYFLGRLFFAYLFLIFTQLFNFRFLINDLQRWHFLALTFADILGMQTIEEQLIFLLRFSQKIHNSAIVFQLFMIKVHSCFNQIQFSDILQLFPRMANNSAKKNQTSIRTLITILNVVVYGSIGWFLLFNIFFLIGESISIWHMLLCIIVSALSYFCLKQIIKCWEMQLPSEAVEYYYDLLALNTVVCIFDPLTHSIWHAYWAILLFILWHLGKWFWSYITPKYEEVEELSEDEEKKRKKKEEKKERIKYVKH